MFGPDPEGATPLTADERAGLIADWIATRDELNLVEQRSMVIGLAPIGRAAAGG